MNAPVFVADRHLGGYIARSPSHPHGDWWTWCPGVWDWMAATFKPETLIDVGCGEGHAIRYFLDHCCIDAVGIDGMVSARDAGIPMSSGPASLWSMSKNASSRIFSPSSGAPARRC